MNKINKDSYRFIKGDSSLIEVFNFFSAVEDNHGFKINLERQREKTLSIKGSDVSYRVLNHWCNKGLIEDNRESNKESSSWRRFSIFDRLWMEVIKELRGYGVSLDIIKKIREKMSKHIVENSYGITNFEYAVYRCKLTSKSQTHLLVFKDGFSEIASELDIESASMVGNWDSYIDINLNNIWGKFSDKFLSNKAKSFALADDEFELLAALRLENNSEITVQMNEFGKINMLKKKRLLKTNEIENYVSSHMKFGESVQKFKDGKCYLMEVVEQVKI
jgi:DNA-binding transcriptional MerR regulator